MLTVLAQKFASRKARKHASQGGRLCLPAMELAYMMQALEHASQSALQLRHLPTAQDASSIIRANVHNASRYEGNGKGFWDDYCLAHFLEGICWRFIAYPVSTGSL